MDGKSYDELLHLLNDLQLKNEALVRSEYIGKILGGLPPIGSAPLHCEPYQSQMKAIKFDLSETEENVGVLENLPTAERSSTVWKNYANKGWESEARVRNCVEAVLFDCIEATCLDNLIRPAPEVSFPSIDTTKKDRTDLAILQFGNVASVVGAIEVKKPPNSAQIKKGTEFDMPIGSVYV